MKSRALNGECEPTSGRKGDPGRGHGRASEHRPGDKKLPWAPQGSAGEDSEEAQRQCGGAGAEGPVSPSSVLGRHPGLWQGLKGGGTGQVLVEVWRVDRKGGT